MREDDAARLGIATISDLARSKEPLRFGLSHEFLVRADGWGALKKAYALPFAPGQRARPRPGLPGACRQAGGRGRCLHHRRADRAAEAARAADDRKFFPRYDAVLLMRAEVDPQPLAKLCRPHRRRHDACAERGSGNRRPHLRRRGARLPGPRQGGGRPSPPRRRRQVVAAADLHAEACSRPTCRACCASTSRWCSRRLPSRSPSACRWACWRIESRGWPAR
jgi:hypothetical protein